MNKVKVEITNDRGTAFQHGNESLCIRILVCAPQIEAIWLQQKALLRDPEFFHRVGEFHIQFPVFIYKKLIRQRKIIAVRIEPLFIKRLDNNFLPQMFVDLST